MLQDAFSMPISAVAALFSLYNHKVIIFKKVIDSAYRRTNKEIAIGRCAVTRRTCLPA